MQGTRFPEEKAGNAGEAAERREQERRCGGTRFLKEGAPRTAIMHQCCIGVYRELSLSRCMLAPGRVDPHPLRQVPRRTRDYMASGISKAEQHADLVRIPVAAGVPCMFVFMKC